MSTLFGEGMEEGKWGEVRIDVDLCVFIAYWKILKRSLWLCCHNMNSFTRFCLALLLYRCTLALVTGSSRCCSFHFVGEYNSVLSNYFSALFYISLKPHTPISVFFFVKNKTNFAALLNDQRQTWFCAYCFEYSNCNLVFRMLFHVSCCLRWSSAVHMGVLLVLL